MLQIPLWVYMAIMAAGTAAQAKGASKVSEERAKAMKEERERRQKLTRENEAAAENSKQLFSDAQAREDARAAEIAPKITPSTSAPVEAAAQSGLLDPNAVPHATESVAGSRDAITQARGEVAKRAQAIAAANSFGSVMAEAGRGLGHNAQDIDRNSTSMRMWNQNVLPARLNYANETGRDWNTTGDILKLIGTIMGPMALGGGAPAAQGLVADPSVAAAAGGQGALMGGSAGMSFDPYAVLRASRNARFFGPPL